MGSILHRKFQKWFGASSEGYGERVASVRIQQIKIIYKEIEVSKLDNILSFLAASAKLDLQNFDILIYGGGGQSKQFYRGLAMDNDVEILWTGWPGPRWTSFLSFIPGQAGLIRLLKQERLKTLYEELAALSASYLCYVPKPLTLGIKTDLEQSPFSHNPMKVLESQDDFLWIQAEMDDTITRKSRQYYLFDYLIGAKSNPEIQNLFATSVK